VGKEETTILYCETSSASHDFNHYTLIFYFTWFFFLNYIKLYDHYKWYVQEHIDACGYSVIQNNVSVFAEVAVLVEIQTRNLLNAKKAC